MKTDLPFSWIVRQLGCVPYDTCFEAMQAFTAARQADTPDELWVVEHPPVFTLGQAGKPEHLLKRSAIPVIQVDRGGQITYHGPGQIVVYLLLDLRRRRLFVRDLVSRMEQAIIDTLAGFSIAADRKTGAPGVYVAHQGEQAKIAALGIKVRNQCTYHGLALNVAMDLSPFLDINPCGYEGLVTVDMATLGVCPSLASVEAALLDQLQQKLA